MGDLRGVVGKDRYGHVSNRNPLLSSGSAQDIQTVHVVVKSSNNGARTFIGFRFRLDGAVSAVQERLFLQLKSIPEQ